MNLTVQAMHQYSGPLFLALHRLPRGGKMYTPIVAVLEHVLLTFISRVKQQVEELEAKWKEFATEAQLRETGEGVEDALRQLGSEIKTGFGRIKDAVTERDRQKKIESLAHQLWVERGSPQGSPEVDWAEAERRVDESAADSPTP